MTLLELEQRAAGGEKIPKDTTFSQKMLFCCLRAVYYTIKLGGISREQGKIEKKELMQSYGELEMWESIFTKEIRISNEINKLTAPCGDLGDKTKEELLMIVKKIIALRNGGIRSVDDEM